MRGGAIGDFVFTLPAIDALRQHFPHAKLRIIGSPSIAALAKPDQIVDHNSAAVSGLYCGDSDFPENTRDLFADADLVIAYAVDPDGELTDNLCTLCNCAVSVHDPRISDGSVIHICDHLLSPIHELGIPVANRDPRIDQNFGVTPGNFGVTPTLLTDPTSDFVNSVGVTPKFPKFIVIHPGSGGRHKCWPIENFVALFREIEAVGYRVVFASGPAEESSVNDLRRILPDDSTILRPTGILELTALVASADLFIGNDSGPGQIAAAVGIRTLLLFGPTDPRIWAPRHGHAHYLQAKSGEVGDISVIETQRRVLQILAE